MCCLALHDVLLISTISRFFDIRCPLSDYSPLFNDLVHDPTLAKVRQGDDSESVSCPPDHFT